jgi:hypothetical protein
MRHTVKLLISSLLFLACTHLAAWPQKSSVPQNLILSADGYYYFVSEGTVYRALPALGTAVPFASNTSDNGFMGPLIQGGDGNLYLASGQTVSLSGEATAFYSGGLTGGFTQASDGNYYAINTSGPGIFVKVTPAGSATNIYTFCDSEYCPNGSAPAGSIVQASDGAFYGTAISAGTSCLYCYTFFALSMNGTVLSAPFSAENGTQEYVAVSSVFAESQSGELYFSYNAGTGFAGLGDIAVFNGTSQSPTYDIGAIIDGGLPDPFLASDLNYYDAASSGFYRESESGQTSLLNSAPTFCPDPNSETLPMQGSDGNFYAAVTCSNGPGEYTGEISSYVPSLNLAAPVQVTLSESAPNPGDTLTLTWQALNTFSLTMQQCYLFQNLNGTLTPLGQLTGTLTNNIFGGTTAVTPSETGAYTYAVTCGGVESGFATVRVGGAKIPSSTSFTTNSPVVLGNQATFSATPTTTQSVGALTGSVSFSYGSLSLGTLPLTNGSASLNLSTAGLPAATYPITATYSGDTNYLSSSTTVNVTVLGYATTVTVQASAGSVQQGQTVGFISHITRSGASGSPGGSVTFYCDGFALGTAPVGNGAATIYFGVPTGIPPGSYSITATYSGDGSDQAASSTGAATITVLAATRTTATVSPNSVPIDQAFTLTATVAQTYGSSVPTGTVTIGSLGYTLGTVTLSNTGQASLSESSFGLPAATYPVTFTYSGDANNAPSSTTVNVTIE